MSLHESDYLSNVWKDGLFKNKVVFCTGGAGSICSAQVRALVHLGADACIVGRNIEKTERMAGNIATARLGAKVIGIGAVDVRKIETLQASVERCVKELGGVDFVIAGAAGNFLASINQLSTNAFKSVMDIDVLGSYNTLKATLPHLIKSAAKHKVDSKTLKVSSQGTGGRIIFVSATAHYTGVPSQTHVSAAKAAIDVLSNNVAIEFGPWGITSNIIAPGTISNTEGAERLLSPAEKDELARRQPLGRFGSVRDVADATVYLLSDAGSYVTGQSLVVDGASWRLGNAIGGTQKYPDFLLSGDSAPRASGQQKATL